MSPSQQAIQNLILLALFLVAGTPLGGVEKLGFELDNSIIEIEEIHRGGPPPDGIPAIDDPEFSKARRVKYLKDSDIVLGFVHGSERRAYPLRILIWHEIVNDTVENLPISVVYCPLCGSAMVFEREINNQVLTFGVSGLLYNSDVLLFDRQTKSLWSQLGMKAVSGSFAGTQLNWLPSQQMTWKAWREMYPNSKVLNLKTGHRRDYQHLPYQGYFKSQKTLFPYARNRLELRAKSWVAGVKLGESSKAYLFDGMPTNQWISDQIGNQAVQFRFAPESTLFEVVDVEGNLLPVVQAYWFAWQAFHPKTEIWSSKIR